MDNWDLSVEKRRAFGRGIKKFKKALISKRGSTYEYIMQVIDDAENKRTIKYCTKYYRCAKFVRYFLLEPKYKFKKIQRDHSKKAITCCWAYKFGKICNGECCKKKYMYCSIGYDDDYECGCNMIPSKAKHIDNCYDDCCNIFEYRISPRGRDFDIMWI
jgi:hypothetical protein